MILKGFGAFCVPFITISDTNTTLTPSKQIDGKWIRNVIFTIDFTNYSFLVTDDGFFGVIGLSKEESLKVLNTIFASSILELEFNAKVATSRDLLELDYNSSDKKIFIEHMNTTQRNVISFERDTPGVEHRINTIDRTKIAINTAKDWISSGNRYVNTEFTDDLLLLAEGFTLLLDQAYRAAFLYSWMLIETFIDKLWQEYAKSLERSSDERKDLFSHRNWFIYHQIEVFSFLGKMSNNSRYMLTKLRKKRNEVIHAKKEISKDEAIKCFVVAKMILLNRSEQKEPFEGIEDY